MSGHVDRLTLVLYIENDSSIDRLAVTAHLMACDGCRAVWEELQARIFLLGDGSIFAFINDPTVEEDAEAIWQEILADENRQEREGAAADAFYSKLAKEPIETWAAILAKHPEHCTAAMVRGLIHAADPELDRNPDRAIALLHVAEMVANALRDDECRLQLGHVWKQRSNALRMLAEYSEAVDAAILAEKFYASLPAGDFDVGQAQYTLAVALFKMTRYASALDALARSRATLEPYGITAPLAKTLMLDAVIRIEQGEVATARETLRQLLPIEEGLKQPLEAARVHANLAECALRLGEFADAMVEAVAARDAFSTLGVEAEELRAEWTIAMIRLAVSEADALDRLHEIAGAFHERNLTGDAGFVKLDIAEELLRRGEWTDAEVIARELVTLFMRAGVTLASVNALQFLRRAVEHREATVATVQYIRAFIAADDPARTFDPPRDAVN
jgi:tetratricopeptide (TPR) repeat protein